MTSRGCSVDAGVTCHPAPEPPILILDRMLLRRHLEVLADGLLHDLQPDDVLAVNSYLVRVHRALLREEP